MTLLNTRFSASPTTFGPPNHVVGVSGVPETISFVLRHCWLAFQSAPVQGVHLLKEDSSLRKPSNRCNVHFKMMTTSKWRVHVNANIGVAFHFFLNSLFPSYLSIYSPNTQVLMTEFQYLVICAGTRAWELLVCWSIKSCRIASPRSGILHCKNGDGVPAMFPWCCWCWRIAIIYKRSMRASQSSSCYVYYS